MSALSKTFLYTAAGLGIWAFAKASTHRRRTMNFQNKTVLITGGSRGLGLELARLFAQEKANLALCARDADELDKARAELDTYGGRVYTEVCDITDSAQTQTFVQHVTQTLGSVDVLINNAGIIVVTPYANATEADFRDAMDTNFWGGFNMIQAVLPHMRAKPQREPSERPRIVNITSIGGKMAVPHLLPYSVSKFAMVGFSEGLQAELHKEGIYVTTICPGLMRTGSPRQALIRGQHKDEYAAFKISDSIPLLTLNAEEAARQIMEACRQGETERILSLPAKTAALLQGIAPTLLADLLTVADKLLPEPVEGYSARQEGKEAEGVLSSSILTTLTDDAARRNNEMGE